MTHQIYVRKTKKFLTKNTKKVTAIVNKVSETSFSGLSPFEESPSDKGIAGKNASGSMNAFDLFQAYTSNIIHKKIIYAR